MNMQGQRFFDTRGFRIAVIAVAAIAVLALAAYFFGTGLRADTSASVAPSPLGSSLTVNRGSAASAVDYASLGLPVFAARSTSAGSSMVDYASLGLPVFADARSTSAGSSMVDYASLGLPAPVPATSASLAAAGESLSAAFHDSSADFYGKPNTSIAAAQSASPAPVSASRSAAFHDSSADFYGKPNTSSAADQYNASWMGFTSPESVPVKPSTADPANPSMWNLITPYAPS